MPRITLVLIIGLAFLCACSEPPKAQQGKAAPPRREPVKITQFYAAPPNPPPGAKSLVCYSTENATEVEIDPADYKVWPSPSRCFEVVPKKKMTLKLTARRDSEQTSQMLTMAPGDPPPELIDVNVDALEVSRGTEMHVCYRAKNAASVTIEPGEYYIHDLSHGCVRFTMEKTTLFKVRVRDKDGDILDGEDVEIKVKP